MAEWRAIYTGISTSPRLVTLEEWEQLLFVQIVVQADQWGRLPGDPMAIKLKCCPASPRTPDEIGAALDKMTTDQRHLLDLYVTNGIPVCQVLEWDEMQPSAYLKHRGTPRLPERSNDSTVLAFHGMSGHVSPRREEIKREEIKTNWSPSEPLSEPSPDGAVSESPKRKRVKDETPYDEVLACYVRHMVPLGNPAPNVVTDGMRKALRKRWSSKVVVGSHRSDSVEFWDSYFAYTAKCPHLVGENGWRASFRWLVTKGNFEKVLNREYEARAETRIDRNRDAILEAVAKRERERQQRQEALV